MEANEGTANVVVATAADFHRSAPSPRLMSLRDGPRTDELITSRVVSMSFSSRQIPTGRVPAVGPTTCLSTMAKNPLLVLSSALIVGLWAGAQVVTIPYVVNLLVLVTAILYVACHSSLILREEQALSRGELPPGDDGTSSDSVPAPPSETLRKEGGCSKVHLLS